VCTREQKERFLKPFLAGDIVRRLALMKRLLK